MQTDKDFLIKICLGIYRVTELFPPEEPLKFLLRKKANEVLAQLLCSKKTIESAEEIFENIGIIKSYFEIAKAQNWIDVRNFLVLEKEYDRLSEEIEKEKEKEKKREIGEKTRTQVIQKEELNNTRHNKIIEVLRKKDRAQIQEFKKIFPDISKRTLRRDFDFLINQGLVERQGEGKYTFYRIKN